MKTKRAAIVSVVLCVCLAFSLFPAPVSAISVDGHSVELSSWTLSVDGTTVNCEKYNIDGYNYFKLRDLAYALKGTGSEFAVGWDEASGIVSIMKGGTYLPTGLEMTFTGLDKSATAQPTSQTILVNGVVRSDLSVFNIGDNNYFKLRDLSEALDFEVGSDGGTSTAFVYSARQALTSRQIADKCSSAVFYIEGYTLNGSIYGSGSGFFISSDGLAITNQHVVENCYDLAIMTSDGEVYFDIRLLDYDVAHDLALIRVGGGPFNYLELGDSDTLTQGQTVYAIGSPKGMDNTLSQGIVSNPRRSFSDGSTYVQISVPIDHGSSGGALIDEYGKVVGVTAAGIDDSIADLNFAIPINDAAHLDLTANANLVDFSRATYPNYFGDFQYLIDYGEFSGVALLHVSETALGFIYVYDMSDFHDAFGVSAEQRLTWTRNYYSDMMTANNRMRSLATSSYDWEHFANSTEELWVWYDTADQLIYVQAERVIQYYSEARTVPDLGWYAYMDGESGVDENFLQYYRYHWSDYYSSWADFFPWLRDFCNVMVSDAGYLQVTSDFAVYVDSDNNPTYHATSDMTEFYFVGDDYLVEILRGQNDYIQIKWVHR